MSIQQLMLGAAGDIISLTGTTVTHDVVDPANAHTAYELQSDGDISKEEGAATTDTGDWINPKVNMASYEVFATLNSGSLTSGTTGAWLALSTTRTWTLDQTIIGSGAAQITLQIRRIGDTPILASAVINFAASVN